jgi:hypothetical protein
VVATPENRLEVTVARSRKTVAALVIALFSLVVIVAITLGVAEAIVYYYNPKPAVQVIKLNRIKPTFVDSTILWFEDTRRNNISCTSTWPDAKVAVFSGDSIFFGSGVEFDEVFTRLLQKQFDDEFGMGSWCIINLSQPAFSFEQKMAWLKEFASVSRIDHVYWEVWFTENVEYRVFNGTAYNFGPVSPAPGHIPEIPVIPLSISEWLFTNSRLYNYAFLTFQPRHRMTTIWWEEKYMPKLDALSAWLAEKGAGLTLVPACPLDRPFSVSVKEIIARDKIFFRLKDYRNADVLFLAEALEAMGADFMRVRHDPCCHYNQEGHKFLAEIFKDVVIRDFAELDAKKADK